MNTCTLGKPFSANNMYTVYKGQIKRTRKYNQWTESTIPLIQSQLTPPTKYPIKLYIQIMDGYGWSDRRDLDNCLKPLLDCLVKAGIFPDDSHKFIEHTEIKFMPWPSKKGESLTFVRYEEPSED